MAMNSRDHTHARRFGPSAPKLTTKDLLHQFWADAYGKEVQTAATYSYTWLADQFGHICLGIIFNFIASTLSGLAFVGIRYLAAKWLGWSLPLTYRMGIWPGLLLVVIGAAIWEWSAYNSSVKQAAGGRFPLDSKLLRDNAIIAAIYIALGGVMGFSFHQAVIPSALISAGVVVVAIVLAPRWLRQKIIWQKASIPYLFRLADAAPNISEKDAKELQKLIDDGAPPTTPPSQVIIGGPIGSGRTSMAAGIGTEFAFKQHKVRYLGLDSLLEFATSATESSFPDDHGPATISYWPWSRSQVVIIDGVGPVVSAAEENREANVERFTKMLKRDLASISGILKQCHTVWVLGDLRPPPPRDELSAVLDDFAKAVARYCDSETPAFVVELAAPPEKRKVKGHLFPSTRAPAQVVAVQNVRRVSKD